jgi:hypothetical protein
MANEDIRFSELEQKMDLVAHLLLMSLQPAKIPSVTEQIGILQAHGLTTSQIARVIGRKPNYVSAMSRPKKASKSHE